MSDPYETSRIRRGLSVLMDEAPVAPNFEDLTTTQAQPRQQRRPAPVAAVLSAAAVISVFAIGGLIAAQPDAPSGSAAATATDSTDPKTTPTTSAAPDTTVAQDDGTRADTEAAASEFLQDIPLPDGLDASAIVTSISTADIDRIMESEQLPAGVTRVQIDRYYVGAHVVSAATCAWIEEWLYATSTDNQAAIDQAVAALSTSREWAVLAEMSQTGDFPFVVWKYADAVAGDGTVPAGYPEATVADTYRSALGCSSS